MKSSSNNALPVISLLTGALVWGLIWYPYRALQLLGISGALATMITYLIAMLCGAFMLHKVWRELPHAGWWALLLVISAGWANLGYVLAMLHGEVMRILLLFYLAPLWTILFSYLLLGERLNRYGWLVIFLAFFGALVMLWEPQLGLPLPKNFSEWLGLSAGIAFALSNVTSRRAEHLSVEAKSFSLWLGTALLTVPVLCWQGNVGEQLVLINVTSGWMLLLMGVVLCATSFAVQYGVTHLSANRAVVLFLFELVVAAVSSYYLANEAMALREWLGAVMIISASLLSGKMQKGD